MMVGEVLEIVDPGDQLRNDAHVARKRDGRGTDRLNLTRGCVIHRSSGLAYPRPRRGVLRGFSTTDENSK